MRHGMWNAHVTATCKGRGRQAARDIAFRDSRSDDITVKKKATSIPSFLTACTVSSDMPTSRSYRSPPGTEIDS